jgi:serine protease Do
VVSADGLVLTAAHVVGGPGRRAMVTLTDGRRLPGHTLGADHELDAGMIRIDNPPRDLPYAPVAKESKLKPGEWVVTVGQPGGMTRGRTPPARLGRVLYYSDEVICTDCTLVGGDSGGPLFNMRGEVVGIHSSIGPAISHNFHVPLKAFQDDWQRLVDGKTWGRQEEEFDPDRPVIGVGGREQGGRCLITEIFSGLPADKAGLKPGDMIAKVDGEEIKTFDELAVRVARKKAGEKLRLSIERGTEKLEVEVAVVTAGSLRPPGDEE